jgi:type IV pilus assembly protein PilB
MRSSGSGRRARDTGTTMAKRQNIGQILMGFGKLTEEDMNRALEYQKENGGYFGEALLALDLVNREELEWSLASQFDLPYVFPDAESVDPDAVGLVSPEWALSHRILPIMKTGASVTVIMDSPLKSEPIEELRKRTGLEVELALASSERIRELIREVYARVGAQEDPPEARGPASLAELLGVALEHGAPRMGISARGARAMGWYEIRGRVRRRLLTSSWREDLEGLLDPPPSQTASEAPARWSAQMSQGGVRRPVEARYLASSGGMEYLFRPEDEGAGLRERFPPPARGTLEEIRLLVRSGSGRFAVTGEPMDLAGEILAYLPSLLLESGARSVHLASGTAPDDVFAVAVAPGSDDRREALRDLRTFHFDAVTADLGGDVGEWAGDVLDMAAAAFLRWPEEVDGRVVEDTGIRWRIHVSRKNGERLDWSLTPMKG